MSENMIRFRVSQDLKNKVEDFVESSHYENLSDFMRHLIEKELGMLDESPDPLKTITGLLLEIRSLLISVHGDYSPQSGNSQFKKLAVAIIASARWKNDPKALREMMDAYFGEDFKADFYRN